MPTLRSLFPQTQVLVASATITTNTTSAALTLPSAQSYRFLVSINTVTGTSPTLIATIATSFDGGTTYQDVLTSTTMSTTGQGCSIVFRPYLASGDVATSQGSSLTSVATINPTAATVANGPINPQYIKVKYVVGGTSPSFSAVQVGVIAAAGDLND